MLFLQSLYQWRVRRKRARVLQLIQKQRQIVREGISIRARVRLCSARRLSATGLLQVTLRVEVPIQAGSTLTTHATALIQPGDLPSGQQLVLIRFLPGDLSQVVVLTG
jgi:hypothetical protein